jgi:hypothetical protein
VIRPRDHGASAREVTDKRDNWRYCNVAKVRDLGTNQVGHLRAGKGRRAALCVHEDEAQKRAKRDERSTKNEERGKQKEDNQG